ncbi:Acyltransferase sidL [Penicillium canariense]|uniref:Acyltransferase sidL n=1 Tax=Penicillium canariense TaxID=189055 RepID=A0A9W9HXZ5_9EURO|nr:Acyltransferase sidL [Penicillium canariense]KAJ5157114.1 Acyltransferase sidL [Penicillium canariense]
MRHTSCHLPNGLSFTVTPVFGGVTFKSNDALSHSSNSTFPPGWTIIIHSEKVLKNPPAEERGRTGSEDGHPSSSGSDDNITRFTTPTLNRDCLYISYIVNPPSSDFKPVASLTRQIAMMLWATLWWYFHEPEPDLHLETVASSATPHDGRPKGEWLLNIKREGIFQGRNLLQKLERMGLIASQDSSVGLQPMETRDSSSWSNMFVSRRSFWQLDPRLFLFTLTPRGSLPSPSLTPFQSRHASPARDTLSSPGTLSPAEALFHTANVGTFTSAGPFTSASHLPTYYPPAPTQYTFTNGVRHPVRPKPPHQGEVFYVRHVPSVTQYLSFRVPFLPMTKPGAGQGGSTGSRPSTPNRAVSSSVLSIEQHLSENVSSDLDTLHRWMNDPRVEAMWQVSGERDVQEKFLLGNLTSRHSFPAIGCWDGKPFGYFEIYWVKEDPLGRLVDHVDNYDRGIHVLVGEQEFRGPHRVAIWLSALVHYCFLSDMRTETVYLEPRVDNAKFIKYLQEAGFYKEGEVSFPHKQSAVMKIKRDSWEAPAL